MPHIAYLYSIFLAGILAKFMIAGQEIAPLAVKDGSSLYWLIIRRTTFDTMIALFLRYILQGLRAYSIIRVSLSPCAVLVVVISNISYPFGFCFG